MEGNSAMAKHYIDARMEPIEVMQATMPPLMFQGFLLGNVIKYSLREKDPKADKLKVKQYDLWLYMARNNNKPIKPLRDVCPDHSFGLMYCLPAREQYEKYLNIMDYEAEVETAASFVEYNKQDAVVECNTRRIMEQTMPAEDAPVAKTPKPAEYRPHLKPNPAPGSSKWTE